MIKQIGADGVIPAGLSCEKLPDKTSYFLMLFNFVLGVRIQQGRVTLSYTKRVKETP